MEQKKEVTFVVRMLFNQIRRLADCKVGMEQRITPMQARVIGYLVHHPQVDVYQRDLEREFQIRRSTASTILQTMEKGDLLTRVSVPQDARLKKIMPTQRAVDFSDHFQYQIREVEKAITQGVSQKELDDFFKLVTRFENNLKAYSASSGICVRPSGDGEDKK
jgi:DNA-binding MarR family transcriptional regulator